MDATIREKLEYIKKAHGFSNDDELASLLGYSRASISKWRRPDAVLFPSNIEVIDREYQRAQTRQRKATRSDDDYRRRAKAALDMLEGEQLARLSEMLCRAAFSDLAVEYQEPDDVRIEAA